MSSTLIFDPTCHAYRLAGGRRVRSVTGVLRAAGLLLNLEQWGTRAALERGTAVHALCALVDHLDLDASGVRQTSIDWPSTLPPPPLSIIAPGATVWPPRVFCPDDLLGYVDAYLAWRRLFSYVWTRVETVLYRADLMLAGTPDRIGLINARPAVVEIKTGPPATWHHLQTVGYDLLDSWPLPRDRFGLYLREDGKFKFTRFDDPSERRVFLRLLEAVA